MENMSLMDQVYERIENSSESVSYSESDSEIAQFYANRTLLITGVTGFLGKCILEKLLRSCSNIKHIYIMMRESPKESLEQRTEKLFQHEVFNGLREKYPDYQKKVTTIRGDLVLEDLGLSDNDRNKITNEVDIICHSAANVQFLEKIRVSLKVNVLGTKRMLDLARECKHLDAFVYISTAYSHLYLKNIEEKFYPFKADLKVIHQAIEDDEKDENGLSEEAQKLLFGQHPNVYAFSKAFCEQLVKECREDANFAPIIYRPSIVTAPFKEPLPGWWANTLGPTLIFLAGPLGLGHVGYLFDYPLDCIPSDLAVNALFAIIRGGYDQWKSGQNKALIFNYGSSTVNPKSLIGAYRMYKKLPESERPLKAIWKDFMICTQHYWLFWFLHYILHLIPAIIVDLVLFSTGKKPRMISIFWKATKLFDMMFYFANGNWRINMPNTLEIIDKMNPADQQIFYCDIRSMSWTEYSWYAWRGLKKYILKEEISSEAARRRYVTLWYLHYGMITISVLGLCYYLLTKMIAVIS